MIETAQECHHCQAAQLRARAAAEERTHRRRRSGFGSNHRSGRIAACFERANGITAHAKPSCEGPNSEHPAKPAKVPGACSGAKECDAKPRSDYVTCKTKSCGYQSATQESRPSKSGKQRRKAGDRCQKAEQEHGRANVDDGIEQTSHSALRPRTTGRNRWRSPRVTVRAHAPIRSLSSGNTYDIFESLLVNMPTACHLKLRVHFRLGQRLLQQRRHGTARCFEGSRPVAATLSELRNDRCKSICR